jgi:hypothetical protein
MASEPRPVVDWAAPRTDTSADITHFEGGSISAEPGARYRSAAARAKVVQALLALTIGLYALDIALSVYGVILLSDLANTTLEQVNAFDGAVTLVARATLGLLIITGIAFLAWLHRTVSNVPALGGGKPAVSPNASVGWWFVPFANLVKPYRIVVDLWKRLATSSGRTGTGIVLAWWATYIGGNVLGYIYGLQQPPNSVEAFNGRMAFNIVVDAVVIAAAVMAIVIVREIERRSDIRAAAIAAAPPLGDAVAEDAAGSALERDSAARADAEPEAGAEAVGPA